MKRSFLFSYLLIFSIALNLFAKEEKISLQLQWLDQFQFAGYYIAKEKGFYKELGLDVEIKGFKKNLRVVDEVMANRVQYGVGRSSLIVEKSKGKEVIALAAIFQSSPSMLLALESSNIKTVQDFRNKRVMLTQDALGTTSLSAMLASQGLSFKDTKIQKHSFNLNDLITKKTDLMFSYISNEPYRLRQKGIKYKIFSPTDYGFDFYADFLFTSLTELNNHPKRVDDFLNASLKGWTYAFNNIEESVDIILQKYNSQKKTKEALIFEAHTLKKLAFYNTNQIGLLSVKKLQRIYDIYKVMGLAKNEIDFNEFLYSKIRLALNKEEREFIKNHIKLKVHNDRSWPPYNFNENGLPKGFSIDYMNLIAKKVGLKIEYVSNKGWNEYLEMIRNKDLDIMLNIVNTPQRAEFINFTSEYAKNLPAIYTLSNRTDIKSLNELTNKTVAIPKGFYTEEILEKYYPKIKISYTKNIQEALKLVAFKKVDAAISDYAVANYLLQQYTISNVSAAVYINDKRFERSLNIGTRKDLPILRNIIQKGINNISDEEQIILRRKWFAEEIKFINKHLYFTEDEKSYLQKIDEIKMCIDPNWAPFESNSEGKHVGMVADYISYFSKLMNRPINLVPTQTWIQSLEYVKSKKCDILPAITMSVDKLDYLNFTKPYMVLPFVIATNINKGFIENIEQIIDKPIGMVKGYSSVNIFKNKYQKIKIQEYSNITKGLEALNKGEIYGFVDTAATISYVINKNKLFNLKIAGKLTEEWRIGLGIRNDHPLLLSIFQKLISSLSEEEKTDIYKKWISIKFEQGFNYDLYWKVIIPILSILIIIIFYLWNIKLKQEIKNRKKLERKLKASIYDFKTLVNSTLEAIFIFDKNGYCIEANNEAIKLFKFSNSMDILGKHMMYLGNEDFQRLTFENKIQDDTVAYEASFKKKDGDFFPALVKGINSSRGSKKIYITSIIDLSDLKEKEKLLFQQSKMALMGEMMSAIAHQWRQPLNAIAALNMTVETKLEFSENGLTLNDYTPISEKIQNQLNYMSKTIDDFRDFFVPSKRKVNFSIGKAINNVCEMMSPQLKSNNIEVQIDAQNIIINGYLNEFKQVLINIINNSKDAILSKKRKIGHIYISVKILENKKNLISIRDNGGGIDEDIILKIFDPYFTTKFKSQGTGIGLYMSKMIIEKSMLGKLSVRNTESGAVFDILI